MNPERLIQHTRETLRILRRSSFLLFLLVLALNVVGILFIYGTGQQTGGSFRGLWMKQLVWITAGSGAMLVLARLDYALLGRLAWGLYGLSLLLLVGVLAFGIERNGARSWFRLGPITVQPAEMAKLALIVILAWVASRPAAKIERWRTACFLVVLAGLPVFLIALQPDLGSALTMGPIVVAVLWVAGIPKRWLVYAVLLGLLISPLVYRYGLQPHQRQRLRTFIRPASDVTDSGWNAHQSLLAVGSGGFTGKGWMHGTQNTLGFLPRPVAPTDFIFSVIAEESGFIGGAALVTVFGVVLCLAMYIATKARDRFGTLIATGVAVLLSIHVYVNIGMTMGMAPIIGIPLPFVSYGGSFMIAMLSCIGLLQSVYIRRTIA